MLSKFWHILDTQFILSNLFRNSLEVDFFLFRKRSSMDLYENSIWNTENDSQKLVQLTDFAMGWAVEQKLIKKHNFEQCSNCKKNRLVPRCGYYDTILAHFDDIDPIATVPLWGSGFLHRTQCPPSRTEKRMGTARSRLFDLKHSPLGTSMQADPAAHPTHPKPPVFPKYAAHTHNSIWSLLYAATWWHNKLGHSPGRAIIGI